jgi:hypothetical protein
MLIIILLTVNIDKPLEDLLQNSPILSGLEASARFFSHAIVSGCFTGYDGRICAESFRIKEQEYILAAKALERK